MKTFKQLIAEVAQPNNEDELNFKAKHSIEVIDHPASEESQHSAEKKSPRRRADYEEGEDEDVYEEKKLDPVGKADADIDNDGDTDKSDEYLHARRKAIARAMKEAIEKKLDPVGKADADIDNDGDTDKSDEYLHARRKAIAKAMKEEVSKDHMDKALAAINARITKKGDAPKYPSFDKAPEDIKTAVKNLAKQYAKQKNEEVELIEKAVSQAQQQAAGVALAVKRGDKPKSSLVGASKEMYKMSEKDLEDFAKTKHKGLPQRVDEANASKIIASVNAGDSIDVTVQKNLNKRGDNKDEILKVIRDYNWKKRMKKEEVNLDEAVPTKKEITRALQSIKAQPKEKVTLKKAPWDEKNEEVSLAEAALTPQQRTRLDGLIDMAAETSHPEYEGNENTSKYINLIKKEFGDAVAKQVDDGLEKMHWGRDNQSYGVDKLADRATRKAPRVTSAGKMNKQDVSALKNRIMSDRKLWGGIAKKANLPEEADKNTAKKGKDFWKFQNMSNKDIAASKKAAEKKESFELSEAFKAGAVKLSDGSSVIIKEADAKLLNQLVNELTDKNREAMMKTAMKDKRGFNEILGFAKEAL